MWVVFGHRYGGEEDGDVRIVGGDFSWGVRAGVVLVGIAGVGGVRSVYSAG